MLFLMSFKMFQIQENGKFIIWDLFGNRLFLIRIKNTF